MKISVKSISFAAVNTMLAFSCWLAPELPAADWPLYRAEPGLSGSIVGKLPRKPKIIWSYNAGDAIESAPVAASNKIVFGCRNGTLHCLNGDDGSIVWTLKTGNAIEAPPSIADNQIYVANLSGELYKISLERGTVSWIYRAGTRIYAAANLWQSTDHGAIVTVGDYNFIMHGIDAQTGQEIWNLKTTNFIHSAAAIESHSGFAVWGGCDAQFRIADCRNGKIIRQIKLSSYLPAAPAIRGGRAYIGTYSGDFYAIDLASGKIAWKFSDKTQRLNFSVSPALSDQYTVVGDKNGNIRLFEPENGKAKGEIVVDGEISGLVIVGDELLTTTMNGSIYIHNLTTLRERWHYSLGPAIAAPPAVWGNKIIVADLSGKLYLFSD